jgi:hypothetical protein
VLEALGAPSCMSCRLLLDCGQGIFLKHSSIVLGVPRRISHNRCAGVQAIWNHRGPTGLIARLARWPVWSDCLPVACPRRARLPAAGLVARLARLPVW